MYFFLAYMLTAIGGIFSGMGFLLPLDIYLSVPPEFKYILFGMGLLLAMMGLIMLHFRSIKVGANHLINPGDPNRLIWFYIYKDGNMKIVPARRDVSGLTYCKKLDSEAQQIKSYRLFDHTIEIIPETIGHSVDLGACVYGYFLKSKHGFKSLSEARSNQASQAIEAPDNFVVGHQYVKDGTDLDKELSK